MRRVCTSAYRCGLLLLLLVVAALMWRSAGAARDLPQDQGLSFTSANPAAAVDDPPIPVMPALAPFEGPQLPGTGVLRALQQYYYYYDYYVPG